MADNQMKFYGKTSELMRTLVTGFSAGILTLAISFSAFAGSWQQNEKGWWWQNNDGSYPVSRWVLLDGNRDGSAQYYYFDADGYLMENTTTPDHRTVNADGALVRNGSVVERKVSIYTPPVSGRLKASLNPELPLSLLGLSVDELQTRFGEELELEDKADSLEYLTISSYPGYEFVVRRGVVKTFYTTPDNVLDEFEETKSLARMRNLLNAAGMFTDADTDFMLKAYYNGYEFTFEYRYDESFDYDSRVGVSYNEP
ncbi:MAG: hypothetical protein Q4C63_08510 [Eubacteriales bacterium]|nr:hypothetical protein [Eubacteriales bacterium]